jgi:RimJ/RimL family protein N-acetyltransferase
MIDTYAEPLLPLLESAPVTMVVPSPRAADAVPRLEGRHARLRAVTAADYPYLMELQTAPEQLIRWRYRGRTFSPEQMQQSLWQSVLTQYLVVREDNGEPSGLVVAYNPDHRHQYAWLAMIVPPDNELAGWTFEAMALFISHLFETFGFHKLYLEMIEFNYERVASGAGTLFHVEGCLRDHELHFGRRWHQYLLAIYADEWTTTIAKIAPWLVGDRL